ncbi:hypothetical protein BDY24DRAFT_386086 [Mrakia frigida]|uniref:uncharacterized protein n=1 Tax=Mrakia frigida TaxID=29902 RepID=UPI003FCC0364
MSLSGELLELPAEFKGGTLTEAEREARRAETARRRKNQSEKKLEDDKVRSMFFVGTSSVESNPPLPSPTHHRSKPSTVSSSLNPLALEAPAQPTPTPISTTLPPPTNPLSLHLRPPFSEPSLPSRLGSSPLRSRRLRIRFTSLSLVDGRER